MFNNAENPKFKEYNSESYSGSDDSDNNIKTISYVSSDIPPRNLNKKKNIINDEYKEEFQRFREDDNLEYFPVNIKSSEIIDNYTNFIQERNFKSNIN